MKTKVLTILDCYENESKFNEYLSELIIELEKKYTDINIQACTICPTKLQGKEAISIALFIKITI